jgi:hypothetical protein
MFKKNYRFVLLPFLLVIIIVKIIPLHTGTVAIVVVAFAPFRIYAGREDIFLTFY